MLLARRGTECPLSVPYPTTSVGGKSRVQKMITHAGISEARAATCDM